MLIAEVKRTDAHHTSQGEAPTVSTGSQKLIQTWKWPCPKGKIGDGEMAQWEEFAAASTRIWVQIQSSHIRRQPWLWRACNSHTEAGEGAQRQEDHWDVLATS